jgi:hypothetical protein
MKEAPDSSETSVLTRATRRNNPEDTILHSLINIHQHISLDAVKFELLTDPLNISISMIRTVLRVIKSIGAVVIYGTNSWIEIL